MFNCIPEPSTPGKFIVWFRNETTLLVLWQPSYPASVFTHYKVLLFFFSYKCITFLNCLIGKC